MFYGLSDADKQSDEQVYQQDGNVDFEKEWDEQAQDKSKNQSEHKQRRSKLSPRNGISHFLVDKWFPKSILVIHPEQFGKAVSWDVFHGYFWNEIDFSTRPPDSAVDFLILISEHGLVEIAYFLKNAFFETSEGNRVSFNNTAASYSE